MQNFHNHAYPRESRGQQALRVDITTRILLSVALPSLSEQVEPALLSAGLIVDPALPGQLIGRFSGTRQSGNGSPSARIQGGHRATTI